jgi:uroporphyrinogen-III synthase
MRLWVTRTEPGANRTAGRLRDMGHEPIVAPVLAYRALPGATVDLTDASALAFTSRNAVRVFADLSDRRDLKTFVVGKGTADAASERGFEPVVAADGDIADLVDLIRAEGVGPGVLVWPGPTEPAGDLVAALADDARVSYQPIYETHETGASPPSAAEGVLIHSPKGARAVAKCLRPERAAQLSVFAISDAAAAPLSTLPFIRVAVAPRPTETALLGLIEG